MTTSFSHDSAELAAAYDRLSDFQFEGGKRLVERLDVNTGDRVLDVGCGTGRLARWIGEQVGSEGRVLAIDPLIERVTLARAAGAMAQVTFEVGQAEDLGGHADASFDVVCMSAVFHWVADKKKALSEAHRVLRVGGRLGMTTLPRELLFASTSAQVCSAVLGRSPYAERADLSALALASRGHTVTDLIGMVLESGLELRELHVVQRHRTHTNGEAAVDFMQASSFGNLMRVVPEELRAALRKDLVAAFEARKGPKGVPLVDHGVLLVAARL
jgi:SAM-dependent methyltransferase